MFNIEKQERMTKQDEFISLFDYLGRPAGGELGKKIWEIAKSRKEKFSKREIGNGKYTGKIILYKRKFLNELFEEGLKNFESITRTQDE